MTGNRAHEDGDPFAEWDAVYVLGALSPEDRAEYEAHLGTCNQCQASVADTAGIPGLLSRVPVQQLYADDREPAPSALLPRLLADAARDRRRDRWHLAAAGLVAAACVIGVLVAALAPGGRSIRLAINSPSTGAPSVSSSAGVVPTLTLTPVGQTVVQGTVQLQSLAWGTRIRLQCMHGAGTYGPAPTVTPGTKGAPDLGWYVLFAVLKDKSRTELASWAPVPGKSIPIEGDTMLRIQDIDRLVVENSHQVVVLSGSV